MRGIEWGDDKLELWGNILTSAKVKGVILSVLHHTSLCIKQTASTTNQQISKAKDLIKFCAR